MRAERALGLRRPRAPPRRGPRLRPWRAARATISSASRARALDALARLGVGLGEPGRRALAGVGEQRVAGRVERHSGTTAQTERGRSAERAAAARARAAGVRIRQRDVVAEPLPAPRSAGACPRRRGPRRRPARSRRAARALPIAAARVTSCR